MPDSIRIYRVRHVAPGAAALALALCVATIAYPQEKSEVSQAKKSSTVIRATTRVVSVSLVATDAQGNPVKDLAKSEVTILDDGKPRVISFFSAVDDTQLLPTGPALGADTYTNLPTGRAEPPSATILLFDALNSKWTSQGYGLERVRKFLRQVEPGDHIGLYVLSDDLKVLHDFRDDASDLVRAIDRYDEKHGKVQQDEQTTAEQSGSDNPPLDRFLSGKDNRYRFALEPPDRFVPNVTGLPAPGPRETGYTTDKLRFARQMTIASLEQIGRQLSSTTGRKSLVWVTDAVRPLPIAAYYSDGQLHPGRKGQIDSNLGNFLPAYGSGDMERMERLMNEAGVAVYPVGAEGLETQDLAFRETGGAVPDPSALPFADPVAILSTHVPASSQHMDMEVLASRTGGRAYFNRNDLENGLRLALDDARFNYSLAYYPDHNSWRGEWRKIEVKVDRPGVKVLARNGYFALPDVRPMAPESRFEFLSELAASPLDSPQLPMTVHIAASSDSKGPRLHAQLRLNPFSMLALQDDGKWKGSFEVVFMQMGKHNKLLDLTVRSVDADLSEEQYAGAAEEGYQLPADLKFMPGAEELCVILRDKLSEAAGSVHIPLARYAAPLRPH